MQSNTSSHSVIRFIATVLLIATFPVITFSQEDTTAVSWSESCSGTVGFDFTYGRYPVDLKSLGATFGSDIHVPAFATIYGITSKSVGSGDVGFFGFWWTKDVELSYNRIETSELNQTDSTDFYLTGYSLSVNFGKDLLHKKRALDVIFYYGYTLSQLKLTYNSAGEAAKYRNPAFMFNFALENRVNLYRKKKTGGLGLGFKIGYFLDASKSRWKKREDWQANIPGTKLSALYAQGMVSFLF
jgi:hypothetical protein